MATWIQWLTSAGKDGVVSIGTNELPIESGGSIISRKVLPEKNVTNTIQTLTDGPTISWDMSLGLNAIVTLGGNRTLNTPTNIVVGSTCKLVVKQDATGSRTLTFPAIFKWPSGISLGTILTTQAGAVDIFEFWVESATIIHGNFSIWDSK